MVSDGHGGVWVAGEDSGIYHGTLEVQPLTPALNAGGAVGPGVTPNASIRITWQHFDHGNAPGLPRDSITSLCVDAQGRLWAGTNRSGVAVFNGEGWKSYDMVTGPLGCHVYGVAYDRLSNQVWIATENGLSIYQCGGAPHRPGQGLAEESGPLVPRYAAHTWHYLTTADGLPPNPDAIAFGSDGTLFVGTLCGGLAVGRRTAAPEPLAHPMQPAPPLSVAYHWRVITGPWRMPTSAYGPGLPSSLINAVTVSPDGRVYVATDLGLAVSADGGQTFHFERGRDYAAKVTSRSRSGLSVVCPFRWAVPH